MAFRLSQRARRDLDKVLAYSLGAHGREAASRYQRLLRIAMDDVAAQPYRNGTRPVPGRTDARFYSISHSRARMPKDQQVVRPVHQIVYRIGKDDVVDILAVIGDSYPAARVVKPKR